MSRGAIVRFEDVLTIKNGKNQSKVENPKGKYPIYGSGGIMGYADDFICPENTVIVGRKGNINKPIFVSEKFWNVDTAFGLVANTQKLLPKYLYYFCENYDFEKLNTTVTIPSLTKSNLLKIHISMPNLETQKKIADVLDKAKSLIDLRKKQIEKMDLLIKSKFIEMFGDPVTNPKGWVLGTIRDIVSDVRYGTSSPSNEDGSYIYLRMNNITYDGHIDLSSIKHINVEDKDFEKYAAHKGDLLFNRTNSKELVGKAAVYRENLPVIIAGYIIRVRTNERANSEYLSAVLNSKYGKSTLYEMCKSIVGQSNINAQELQGIKVLIPPINLQNQFACFVDEVENQKKMLNITHNKMEINYKSLMQEYFG